MKRGKRRTIARHGVKKSEKSYMDRSLQPDLPTAQDLWSFSLVGIRMAFTVPPMFFRDTRSNYRTPPYEIVFARYCYTRERTTDLPCSHAVHHIHHVKRRWSYIFAKELLADLEGNHTELSCSLLGVKIQNNDWLNKKQRNALYKQTEADYQSLGASTVRFWIMVKFVAEEAGRRYKGKD